MLQIDINSILAAINMRRFDMNEEYISLVKDLAEHPKMFEQIKKMLATVKNSDEKIMSAHEAEQQIIDDIRVLGKETIQSWANEQNKKAGTNYRKKVKDVHLNGKKNSIGIPPLDQ